MITKVQSTDLEKSGKEEGYGEEALISLGRGNRIDSVVNRGQEGTGMG